MLSKGSEHAQWPSPAKAWLMVALLFCAYTLSFVDRQILVLLIGPIQRDLGIGDVGFSLLSGLAFTFFFTFVGLPLAWVADRWSRRNLVALAILLWSIMTAACGAARNFSGLFAARMGVGVGEAGFSPAAFSMIADAFPPARRGRAMAAFTLASNSGLGLALILGGGIAQWATTARPVETVGVVLQGWQLAFVMVSLPGPLLALAYLALVREPPRQERSREHAAGTSLAAWFREQWRQFLLLSFGFSLVTVALAAWLAWTPAFFGRVHGWNPAKVGTGFGLALLIGGTSGTVVGGWLSDRLLARGRRDGFLIVTLLGSACGLVFALMVPFVRDARLAMLMMAPMCFGFALTNSTQVLSFHAITPNELRGRVIALFLLIGNLSAFTIAPTAVAVISSRILKRPEAIGTAVAIVSAICVPLGMFCLQAARKGLREAPFVGAQVVPEMQS
jgi:MFS family permease